ncbi:hypothetical protein QQG91_04675 [Marivivens sp. LCG002]|uniref:hypothetical protein n=1 Tax=Marivivens sp. LCG002 TaxID=3051171 RepID=UPI0025561F0B|nr:hypothetical protein [Marivivens sp. LCG002]WIV51745.1 hypothetical protein QQG91_04675 [Marivivens sp. LCG002]
MTFISPSIVPSSSPSLAARLSAFFDRLVALGEANYQSSGRAKRIAKLEALSDAELAKLGISRDMIVYHVFRDCFAY